MKEKEHDWLNMDVNGRSTVITRRQIFSSI